jgi:SanA protein
MTKTHQFRLTDTEKKVTGLLAAVFVLFAFINIYIYRDSRDFIFTDMAEVPPAEVALVLGAAVYKSGELTPVLYDRAITAVDLYKRGVVKKILVSGDNNTFNYNEVIPIGKFLVAQGVLEKDIFLDYAGFDTYDSMYRARDVFKVSSVIVITQKFHAYRAIYIARNLGLDARALTADKRQYYARNHVREFFATVKAFADVNFGALPKFLGEEIPISKMSGNVPKVPVANATSTSIGTSTPLGATSTVGR